MPRTAALGGVALSLLLGIMIWLRAPGMPALVPDSGLYMDFGSTVPLLYPAFLRMVGKAHLVTAQIGLYAVTCAFLSYRIAADLRRPLIGLLAPLPLLANPQLWSMLSSVMSEGLFLPIAILWIALTISVAVRGNWASALGLAIVSGVAVTVRPAALPLLLISPVLILLRHETGPWRRRLMIASGALILSFAIMGGERLVWRMVHGPAGFTLTASHLFGKAALLPEPGPTPSADDPVRAMVHRTLQDRYEPVRHMLKAQRGTLAYPVLLSFYEVCAQHGCAHEMRDRMGMAPREQNEVIAELARQRILANPIAYLRLALDEYRSMWVIGVRSHPVLGPQYDAQLAAMGPRPLADLVAPEVARPAPVSRATLAIRPALASMGVLTAIIAAVSLLLALRARMASGRVLPAFAAATATHGIAVFIALAGIGEGRYAMGSWPFTAMALLFVLPMLPSRFARRMPGLRTPIETSA